MWKILNPFNESVEFISRVCAAFANKTLVHEGLASLDYTVIYGPRKKKIAEKAAAHYK